MLTRSPGNELALWDSRTKRRVAFDKHNAVAAELALIGAMCSRLTMIRWLPCGIANRAAGDVVGGLARGQSRQPEPGRSARRMALQDGRALIWDIVTDRKSRRCNIRAPCSTRPSAPTANGWRRPARINRRTCGTSKLAKRLAHRSGMRPCERSRVQSGWQALSDYDGEQVVRLWEFAGAPGVILRTRSPSRVRPSVQTGRACSPRPISPRSCGMPPALPGRSNLVDARGADLPCDLQPRRRLRADCQRGSPRPFVGRQDWQRDRRAAASAPCALAAFSRDGKMLVTASGQQLVVWDVGAAARCRVSRRCP